MWFSPLLHISLSQTQTKKMVLFAPSIKGSHSPSFSDLWSLQNATQCQSKTKQHNRLVPWIVPEGTWLENFSCLLSLKCLGKIESSWQENEQNKTSLPQVTSVILTKHCEMCIQLCFVLVQLPVAHKSQFLPQFFLVSVSSFSIEAMSPENLWVLAQFGPDGGLGGGCVQQPWVRGGKGPRKKNNNLVRCEIATTIEVVCFRATKLQNFSIRLQREGPL